MARVSVWLALALLLSGTPAILAAQDAALPTAAAQPAVASVPAAATAVSSEVSDFYAARPNVLVWFKDADTRAAAAKLPAILRRATLDGLADGPALAARVEAAIASGQLADDQLISQAWVKYVQALKAPVDGVAYGDPALALTPPSAATILADARRAPSLAAQVDEVSKVNPYYAALRDAAAKQNLGSDPRVRDTLARLRLIPATGRAILVDVASAQLTMLDGGKPAGAMKVIVGKPDFATPLLAGTIHYVTFNPYWHIPKDVARRKVAPIVLKRGVAYLKAARYQTVAAFGKGEDPIDPASVDWKAVAKGDTDVHIRQLAGPNNMMGAMKFGFVNDFGIYLHDTPHKALFTKTKRYLSLGCIRLEHADQLGQWLLGRDPTPPGDGSEELVQLDKGVPVYITYLSAVVSDDGTVAFTDDVYGLDTPGATKAAVTTAASAQ